MHIIIITPSLISIYKPLSCAQRVLIAFIDHALMDADPIFGAELHELHKQEIRILPAFEALNYTHRQRFFVGTLWLQWIVRAHGFKRNPTWVAGLHSTFLRFEKMSEGLAFKMISFRFWPFFNNL